MAASAAKQPSRGAAPDDCWWAKALVRFAGGPRIRRVALGRLCDSPAQAGPRTRAVVPSSGRTRLDLGESDRPPRLGSGPSRTTGVSPMRSRAPRPLSRRERSPCVGLDRLSHHRGLGGSDANRARLRKVELRESGDETGLRSTVGLFPPGTLEWHRMEPGRFNFITMNWRRTQPVSLQRHIQPDPGAHHEERPRGLRPPRRGHPP